MAKASYIDRFIDRLDALPPVNPLLHRRLRRAWRTAAQRLQLSKVEVPMGLFAPAWLRARSGSLHVQLNRHSRPGRSGTRILVTHLRQGKEGLTVRPRVLASELGDQAFADEFHVDGSEPLALAALDAETRRVLGHLLRGVVLVEGKEPIAVSGSLTKGVLEVRFEPPAGTTEEQLADLVSEVLGSVLALARRLVPGQVPHRIARNLRSEPEAEVRLQTVRLLGRDFPHHAAARSALRSALADPDDRVRLQAALALGKDGIDTLCALVAREETEDSCAARAVAALGGRLPAEQAEARLRQALEWRQDQTARACIETLGHHGRSVAEGLLLQALHSADPHVAVAAARALGRVGTAAAVAQLHEIDPPPWHRELHGAVRQAIAEIQARLTGATPGQLSLPEGEAGDLSFAEAAEPGRLSMAEDEPAGREGEPVT